MATSLTFSLRETLSRVMKNEPWPDEYEYKKANESWFGIKSDIFVTEYASKHDWGKELLYQYGHRHVVTNPRHHFTLLEPGGPGGCDKNHRATVAESAVGYGIDCSVSVNGGFFNMTSGECLGNLVTSGQVIRNSGLRVPSFGLTDQNEFFIGYLSEEMVGVNFDQLISGVVWIVRGGENNVQRAIETESDSIQENFDLRGFANVVSARTAVGFDREGKLVLVELDGKTHQRGLNLFDFADFLISHHGLFSAINLDGGGSASVDHHQVVANYPSDFCRKGEEWRCARRVSSAICLHPIQCRPECTRHGQCRDGKCHCAPNWTGKSCSHPLCASGCLNGKCLEGGVCKCDSGYTGGDCSIPCDLYHYGPDCVNDCKCWNKRGCDSITGQCYCPIGKTGLACELNTTHHKLFESLTTLNQSFHSLPKYENGYIVCLDLLSAFLWTQFAYMYYFWRFFCKKHREVDLETYAEQKPSDYAAFQKYFGYFTALALPFFFYISFFYD